MAKRLLLVDDSPTVRRVVQSALERHGFVVSACAKAESAIELANRERFDVFLFDYMMPGIGGIELLKLLKSQDIYIAPTVLMCTRTDPSIVENLEKHGIVDTITKPFVPDAMVSVIEHAIERGFDERNQLFALSDDEGEDVTVPMRLPVMPSSEVSQVEADSTREIIRNELHTLISQASREELADLLTDRLINDRDNSLVSAIARRFKESNVKEPYALYGDLNAVALPEVMQLMKFQGQTGVLEVSLGDTSYRIAFKEGRILAIRALDPTAEQRLGRYFVETGSISEEELQRILRYQKGEKVPIGQRLLDDEHVDRDQLTRALRAQAEDLMYEMLRAQRGHFALKRGIEMIPRAHGMGLGVDAILFESLRRIDEWRVIEKEVSDFDLVFAAEADAEDERLTDEEAALLDILKTRPMTPRELIESTGQKPFTLCKLLYRLVVLQHAYKVQSNGHA